MAPTTGRPLRGTTASSVACGTRSWMATARVRGEGSYGSMWSPLGGLWPGAAWAHGTGAGPGLSAGMLHTMRIPAGWPVLHTISRLYQHALLQTRAFSGGWSGSCRLRRGSSPGAGQTPRALQERLRATRTRDLGMRFLAMPVRLQADDSSKHPDTSMYHERPAFNSFEPDGLACNYSMTLPVNASHLPCVGRGRDEAPTPAESRH